MKILVTIAARGGSKGLPGKNIRKLNGKPLIGYTIEQALRWGKASRVVVSTDSDEIASVARDFGVELPFIRPAGLATDTAYKIAVIRHAMLEAEKRFSEKYDYIIDLDVTAPLRKISDIDGALNTAMQKQSDVLFSAVPARKNPYFNMVEIDGRGTARLCKDPGRTIARRQDAPEVFEMNASIYVYRSTFLLGNTDGSLFTVKTHIWPMDELSGVDIDTESDFRFVEYLITGGAWKFDYD